MCFWRGRSTPAIRAMFLYASDTFVAFSFEP
jgi:hypothetical protein